MSGLSKISVVLPVLNAAKWLEGCLQSLKDEQIEELIVVDGGSTDETEACIAAFAPSFRVVVLKGADKGIYDAMNKGIAASASDWIYFLGADDRLLPGSLARLVAEANPNTLMVYGNVVRKPSNQIYDGAFNLKKLFYTNICHQSAIYHRNAFVQLGLFNTTYATLSDYAFNIKLFSAGLPGLYAPVTVAEFNEAGRSANVYDEAFWADYPIHFIRAFKHLIPRHELYGRMWKYFSYTLYARRNPLKAARLWVFIAWNQRDIIPALKQLKTLVGKLVKKKDQASN